MRVVTSRCEVPERCLRTITKLLMTLGDLPAIETAQKNLENTIKRMAKDIHDKYIDPPNTTDFGIMFLPFEGIYAEVVRKASLLEDLQRNYKIIVTGPTTFSSYFKQFTNGL